MPRYIDIEPFETETGLTVCHVQTTTHTSDGITVKATRTRDIPTVDPESLRPHGRWTAEHTCTHCGEYALTANLEDSEGEESQLYYHTPSCPWCGAKMDLEEDNG